MIIVCDNYKKDELLNSSSKLSNVKYMSKREFIHKFYFDYNKHTIYELCKEYSFNYENSKMYLDNIYYIEDKYYGVDKLDKLVNIKKYLDSNNLLIYDKLFKDYLKNNEVVFDSIDLDKFDNIMIKELESITSVRIKDKEYNHYNHDVIEFKTMDEEVEYVAIKICELIDNGVSINDIKISGINEDYNNSIKRIFDMYNLRINEPINLYSTNTVRMFIDNFNSDINKTIDILKNSECDNDTIDRIIDIVNSYNFIRDYNLVKDMIISELKSLTKEIHYDNEIEVIDIMNNSIKDEYVFYLNYNQESIPKVHIDDDYITDNIRNLTKLDKLEILNKKERISIKNSLESIKNLIITYKLKSPFSSFNVANVLDCNVIKGIIPTSKNYSFISNKVNLSIYYDDFIKYNNISPNMSLFSKHYKINYKSFNNDYNGINKEDLYSYLDNKLTLSYTSMNDYYKCSFKYYLKYILKIDKLRDITTRHIGSMFHYVLEKCIENPNPDINGIINEYIIINKIEMSYKEKFFFNKLSEELPFLLETLQKQNDYIILKKRLYEEKIKVEYNDKINITFVGVIDKILYDDDIYALVDYKTGNDSIDLSLNYYGINMQLAIYLFLASKRFDNAKFAGFYLQYILNKASKGEDVTKKEEKLKLYGYSNSKYISSFDKTYENSSLIKSLKVKNDGTFYSTSKVLSDDEVNSLIILAENKIKECIEKIQNCGFDINPKNIDGKNVSCEFCPYSDICFKNNKNILYLNKVDNFL